MWSVIAWGMVQDKVRDERGRRHILSARIRRKLPDFFLLKSFWLLIENGYLFDTLGYNAILVYVVAHIVPALVIGRFFNWLLCLFVINMPLLCVRCFFVCLVYSIFHNHFSPFLVKIYILTHLSTVYGTFLLVSCFGS